MRLFLGLLCGVALLAAASGCGTARALVDDREPGAVVEAIRPTSGVSGESVQFEAICCVKTGQSKDDLTYVWNFGGGADPNVSFEESPAVTLRSGSATPYNATLKLTGGCLGENLSLTTPFNLNVAPLSVTAVTGNTGISKGAASMSVLVGTGIATTYNWDFGGAATPSGATGQTVTATFATVLAPTVYQGRVIVSNAYESTEYLFDINVNP